MRKCVGYALLLVLLGGCGYDVEDFAPPNETEFAKTYLTYFENRDFDAIEAHLDPSLQAPSLRAQLEHVAQFFPDESAVAITTIGAHTFAFPQQNRTDYSLTFEYEYPSSWLVANVNLRKTGSSLMVTGVHVEPSEASLKTINRFTLEGAGYLKILFLVAAVVIPLFILAALVVAIRTPLRKRKWLWILFILVGFVRIHFNWATEAVTTDVASFQLLGAGFIKAGPYAPLMLTISLPLGAILFLTLRAKLARREPQELAAN